MEIEKIFNKIVYLLKDVKGIEGIVLGGSRSRGTHHEASDIDIGIYYDVNIRSI